MVTDSTYSEAPEDWLGLSRDGSGKIKIASRKCTLRVRKDNDASEPDTKAANTKVARSSPSVD